MVLYNNFVLYFFFELTNDSLRLKMIDFRKERHA